MGNILLTAFALMLIIESVLPFLMPGLWRETFRRLTDGSLGYREAALIQGPTLFSRRPATYLNPPLRIFLRDDLWASRMPKK